MILFFKMRKQTQLFKLENLKTKTKSYEKIVITI
jgi:hypothetical protein